MCVCAMTHSHVWRDLLTRVTWLTHMCNNPSHKRRSNHPFHALQISPRAPPIFWVRPFFSRKIPNIIHWSFHKTLTNIRLNPFSFCIFFVFLQGNPKNYPLIILTPEVQDQKVLLVAGMCVSHTCVWWLTYRCYTTHSCVTWLNYMCDMTE